MTDIAPRTRHPFLAAVGHRWPTWLALVMTLDNWFDPGIPSPWILLVLPAGYLVIGAVRHRLRSGRVYALQWGGLVAYLALVLAAVSVDARTAGFLVAAGWLAHAVWDLAHHRADRVVPRAYAEWCGVIDLIIGLNILRGLWW